MQPTIEDVQHSLNEGIKLILNVSKNVASWSQKENGKAL